MKMQKKNGSIGKRAGLRMELLFLLTIVLTMLLCGFVSGAQSGKGGETYYESVRIKSGDTLWSIALEYKQEGERTEHMIDKIRFCNQMKTTNIRAGENIIVPVTKAE